MIVQMLSPTRMIDVGGNCDDDVVDGKADNEDVGDDDNDNDDNDDDDDGDETHLYLHR